jgi:hypothetical protein
MRKLVLLMTLGILASFTDAWHITPAAAASKVLAGGTRSS